MAAIKRIIFILMTIFMVFIFWDVVFGAGTTSIVLIALCIFGCLAMGIIDLFIES